MVRTHHIFPLARSPSRNHPMFDLATQTVVILGVAAFAAGFVDSIAGGGGLITIPALLLAGFSPVEALGPTSCRACSAQARRPSTTPPRAMSICAGNCLRPCWRLPAVLSAPCWRHSCRATCCGLFCRSC
ncbi:hypothetical protein BQ8482_380033 [Mesorhizobium delmotii]|uniref:Membrane transporter protein n=1 Tax=Mesorhizobium delmotii TaxID=1631247 RepID=A0A2P9ARQ8_9HYPH|nr:hypothetical protein BQ8482_380033 [Mesorhizobium delmotii]